MSEPDKPEQRPPCPKCGHTEGVRVLRGGAKSTRPVLVCVLCSPQWHPDGRKARGKIGRPTKLDKKIT